MAQKLTPSLWIADIKAGAEYYASVFKSKAPTYSYFPDGRPLTAHVDILGTTFMILGDKTDFQFTESVSFLIDCKDQTEVDHYWNHFVGDGGEESMCGWCKDKFGLSWQVVPDAMMRTVGGPDSAGRTRALNAMMKMHKLVVADLENAYAGN